MATVINSNKLVHIELSQNDLDALENGEVIEVECPHTGETIYLTRGTLVNRECECCGRTIKHHNSITPNITFEMDRFKNGDALIYSTAHNEDDITILLKAEYDVYKGNRKW